MTIALLDWLTHRANVLEFVGESYRFRQCLFGEETGHEEGKTEAG